MINVGVSCGRIRRLIEPARRALHRKRGNSGRRLYAELYRAQSSKQGLNAPPRALIDGDWELTLDEELGMIYRRLGP